MHAIITGASAGLGDGLARKFASLGWNLTLVARREERLRALADELAVECFVRPADLSEPDVAADLVAEAEAKLGDVGLLINNAGIQYVEPAVGVTLERLERIIDVNVVTPLALVQAVLPGMLSRRSGTIVNISSMAGITHAPGMCHYNASKAALAAASESLRAEVAPSGVHVVTVYPGPVESDLEAAAREKYDMNFAARLLPTGTPEGLAKLVATAVARKRPRVFYPRFYGAARYMRVFSQWFTEAMAPPLIEE